MRLGILSLTTFVSLSATGLEDNWLKLLHQSDVSRQRAELALLPRSPIDTPVSSHFGPRLHPIQDIMKPHHGVDYAARKGTPFYSSLPGEVVNVHHSSSYGKTIVIAHGEGVVTRYAHANQLMVSVGDVVDEGDMIGRVGETGMATGPHLHFEIQLDGSPIDPLIALNNPTFKESSPASPATSREIIVAQVDETTTQSYRTTNGVKPVMLEAQSFGQHVMTTQTMWSLASDIALDLSYPSVDSVIDLLVDINPEAFPTGNPDYRLAHVPLWILDMDTLSAVLPEFIMTADTMWAIASELKDRYASDASIYQIMSAIKKRNPHVFIDGNIHKRKSGYPLELPEPSSFFDTSRGDAYLAFQRDERRFLHVGKAT